jgi:hypothetical protein
MIDLVFHRLRKPQAVEERDSSSAKTVECVFPLVAFLRP